jgi:hypothetical protein
MPFWIVIKCRKKAFNFVDGFEICNNLDCNLTKETFIIGRGDLKDRFSGGFVSSGAVVVESSGVNSLNATPNTFCLYIFGKSKVLSAYHKMVCCAVRIVYVYI